MPRRLGPGQGEIQREMPGEDRRDPALELSEEHCKGVSRRDPARQLSSPAPPRPPLDAGPRECGEPRPLRACGREAPGGPPGRRCRGGRRRATRALASPSPRPTPSPAAPRLDDAMEPCAPDALPSRQMPSSPHHSWAWALRHRLATQIQEAGHAEPKDVDALVVELTAVFRTVLERSSRRAWLRMMEALRLIAPFQQLLSRRAELAPYLEGLYFQFRSSQAMVSDLDILGSIWRAFPMDCAVLWADPREFCPREPKEIAKQLPSSREPVFVGQSCPFAMEWVAAGASGMLQPDPVSLQELQRCVGQVGREVAQEETPRPGSLGLMPLTLAADVPTEYPCAIPSQAAGPSLEPRKESPGPPTVPKKRAVATGDRGGEMVTSLEAAELFARKRHLGEISFIYFNVAQNRHFRPYDLVAVPKRLANPQHYIFSPFGVLHVHPEEGSEAFSLGELHRQAVLWQLMQYIPFFRLFLVRKAFVRWFVNVKHLHYLKCREKLSLQLLHTVPHFGLALLHISRLLLQLHSIHWLPRSRVKCYTFSELKRALAQENKNAQGLLSKFLQLCSSVLQWVRDDTYRMVRGLQQQVQSYKLYITKASLYKQRVDFEKLQNRLQIAEHWLQRLGFLALLVNLLLCQNLVSAMQEEVRAFIYDTMKADGIKRKAVLQVHLVFGADRQLMLFPSHMELEDCLLGAVNTVLESVLQMTRIKSEGPAPPENPQSTASEAEHHAAQPSAVDVSSGSTIPQQGSLGPIMQPKRLPTAELCGEKPQLVYQMDVKVYGGLEVIGHRLKGMYPLLSREQLEKDLRSDRTIQEATEQLRALLTMALTETELLCREYTWLGEIYNFVHSWSPSQLESMKSWPAEEYVNRILKLRTWVAQVQKVPRVVITHNLLLLVDCSGIHQDLLPLLASINEDILSLLLSETAQRSEKLIAELSGVLQLYMNVGTDIFTIAKCSQKLEQYQGQMAELQGYVDYVRALNEVIQQCFRPLTPSEESLENLLLDTWDAFAYQQREVSDFIVSRRLSIIAELSSSLRKATLELQELLTVVTLGHFQDPSQNPRAMEEELRTLYQSFQATVVRITDLCQSQRILTGDCMDVTFITGKQGVIEIHTRIWQLFRIITEQITEWKCLAFVKFNTVLAMEKTEEWQKEVISLEHSLPSPNQVLQACLRAIANLQKYLPILLKLGSHFLKLSCWKEIFAVMGVKCPLNMQFTLGQLLSYPLLEHSDSIFRVYALEKSRHYARDTLFRLERSWAEKQFRLVNFILNVPDKEPQPERFRRPAAARHRQPKLEYISKDSGTYILSDTAELKAMVEHSLLTLQNIILSPFSSDILLEAESWASILRSFESLLEAWVIFQQKWVFLNIVFYEMDISLPSSELELRFQRVDSYFREFIQVTCNDPLVLSSVRPPCGSCRESRFVGGALQEAFLDGSRDLQVIIRALDYVLEGTRMGFPRLFFLSNEELISLLATASEPAEASAWAQRCFPGVRQLALLVPSATHNRGALSAELPVVQVTGLVGDQGEQLELCSIVCLSRKATQWLCALEQRMKESVFQQMQQCVAQRLALRPQLDVAFKHRPGPTELPLHMVVEGWATLGRTFPNQCVVLAEEALWRATVEEALSNQCCQPELELKLNLKLEALAHYVRNFRNLRSCRPGSEQLGLLLEVLITLTVQQRDTFAQLLKCRVSSPQAFEWARLLKYHVALSPECAHAVGLPPGSPWVGSPPGCWAEALDRRFHYDYEYLGPCQHLLGSPSLDKTFLGLLLALDDFRCGGLLGHPDVGKSHTVRGLAEALGRQLVTLHCTLQVSVGCLSRYLCGAVHAGALLLLEAAEQLEAAVLSAFSQRLVDLQRMCLSLQGSRGATAGVSVGGSPHSSQSSDSSGSSEGELQPAIPVLELGTDEAEPYQPRVLGNILFGGRLLRVRETYGCIITLDCLPEPLCLAMRPLAMLPPDLTQLAEVTLLAAGFREATHLAEKLNHFLRLEGELNPKPQLGRCSLVREVVRVAVSILFSPPAGQDSLVLKSRPSGRTVFFQGLEEQPAMVKALCLSSLLSGPECPRLQNTRDLLREVFPGAPLQAFESRVPYRLQSALVAQLHEDKLQPQQELLNIAGQLFQALRGAPGVLLLGPAGGGKTTMWRTLAKALSRLAASDAAPGAHMAEASPSSLFQPTSTVCLWPNCLSVAEFVGSLEGSIWQDGVLSRVLQRAATSALARRTGEGSSQQWLVLDGAACAEWLEPISSLFSARPSLSLPNGQKLRIPENVKFLFEMPNTSNVPPSVCTHYSLLYCGGASLWRGLLASGLAPVYRMYSLTQESLAMLRSLAEELFPSTLAFLREHCCSVLLPHTHPQDPVAQGVQETTTFLRLLHALLEQHLRRDRVKHLPPPPAAAAQEPTGNHTASLSRNLDDTVPAHHHLLGQSIFVFAYIWGFGGHLHPRHWPLFEHFARQALHRSQFSIKLPTGPSAFDLCPLAADGTLESFNGCYLSNRVKVLPVTFSVLQPQHERMLFVVDLLLSTERPVLLVGEPGCGKSSFAEMLVQPNHSYHRVCLTPALRPVHLRHLLHKRFLSLARDKVKPVRGAAAKGRCLFLVEDLHLAFVDSARGSSPVVESLRQALSYQQFYHGETLEVQHCPATGFNCFGTLSVPMTGALPLCPRFGRLFSTVVLPLMTRDSLLGLHVDPVLSWLEKFPLLTRQNDLALALVRATINAYEMAKSLFPPSPVSCLFHFSLHDIQKVFKGLFLLRPRPGIHLSSPLEDQNFKLASSRRTSGLTKMNMGTGYTALLSTRLVIRLWMHECLCVFCDPLQRQQQRELCEQMLMDIAITVFCAKRNVIHVAQSTWSSSPPRDQDHHLPSRAGLGFHLPSRTFSNILDAEWAAEEEPEEGKPLFPWSGEVGCPDPWDPVEQAAALALDRPDPGEGLAVSELESETTEAETTEEAARKHTPTSQGQSRRDRHRASPNQLHLHKARRHGSPKKENTGPLLPSHLLLQPGEALQDIVFSKDLGPDTYSPNTHNPYQEKLWKTLEKQLKPLLPKNFLLCSEGLKHILRLSRLFCGPDRHGAIVSFARCTGRRTLVALAARATASLLVEIPAKEDEAGALALLRLASWQAGIMGKRVLLLVHAGVSLANLHLLLALMAEGTCPGLYSPEDTIAVIQALLQENQNIKRNMREELILQRFFQFVRSNLHVVLLLGGAGSLALPPITATALAQVFSSLEVYQPWSHESLVAVASKHFMYHQKTSVKLTRVLTSVHDLKDLMHRTAQAASQIHCCTMAYITSLAAHLPLISPKTFLDFLDTFLLLLSNLQEKNTKQLDRMRTALHKMGEVSMKQQEHTRDVRFLQQKLVKIKEQVISSQREVEREQEVLKQQEKECELYEARIDALTRERDALEKGRELAMRKVNKDYKEALAMLRLQDIEELRSYRQPPATVVMVTDILCLMFEQEPGWENAKLLLNRDNFYEDLVFYPKDSLATELFEALGRAVTRECISEANISSASQPAAALFQWISATYWYHWALLDWQPTIARLKYCDAQITTEKMELGDRRLHSEYLRDATQLRIKELKLKQERQEKLMHQLTQSLQAKEEATTVESSVAEHMANWTTLTRNLESQHNTVYGDALLSAASLCYLGPFPPQRREELLEKWQAVCAGAWGHLGPDDVRQLLQKELPCPGPASHSDLLLAVQQPLDLASLLSSPPEQRLWDRVHKPKDPSSRLVGTILLSSTHTQAHRWPLLVDPDKQACVWLLTSTALEEVDSQAYAISDLVPDMLEHGSSEEITEDNLEVLSLTDPDLEQNLYNAACLGTPVLLTDFEKNVPWCPALQQLMQKELFRGALRSESAEDAVLVPTSFRLYLCTELPLEALAAEVEHELLKSLNVIDLSLSQGALEELLLVEVLRAERKEILKNQQALQFGVLQLEGKLEATEEELVALIAQPQRSLLEEENFMPMVRLLQTQIQALHATHQHMVSQHQDQVALCNKYRVVPRLGVALHLALQQVCRLHPSYSFPTSACVARVRQALLSTKRQETTKQESLELRHLELSKAVLHHFLTEVVPCLREMDRLLYLFLGAVATLKVSGKITPLEWLVFCQGLREPVAKELLQPPARVPCPSWVSAEAWEECGLLENVPGFQGLQASLAGQAAQWQEYFRLPSTMVGLALCPSHSHLRPFQRAILWRILCPAAMSSVVSALTTCLLGWSFTEEMAITYPYSYSRANKPIIFHTPSASAPGSFMHPLLWIQQMATQRGRGGNVVVISFGTPDACKRVWRTLPICIKRGKWLVLTNCHLQEHWDPDLLELLDQLVKSSGKAPGGGLEIHTKFRLWLITAADAPHSMPGLLKRSATSLFCDMPLELKGILARSHYWLQGRTQNLDTEQRLPLLALYGVLLYRQTYAQWTQAETYLWSHGEVLAGLRIQERLSCLTDGAQEALQELAGTMLYGGHVLDSGDAQVVKSLCQACLAPASPLQPGSSLQQLVAAVVGCPNPGNTDEEAAAATQACIEQLPSPMEPAGIGLCSALQQRMLAERSQAFLLALQASQGLWQPRRGPCCLQTEALEHLLRDGSQLVQELQEQLTECGWEVGWKGCPPQGQARPRPRPLQRFLLEEAGILLALLKQVGRDLCCAQECLQGEPCSSRRCTTILYHLKQGRLPSPWLPYALTSRQAPLAWLQTLKQRTQLLCSYLGSISGPLVAHYQLAAFHQPRRLLLAVLQERARMERQELNRYQLHQQVLPSGPPPTSAPEKGIYLSGLELRHAFWKARSGLLQESRTAEPCPLPTIWIQATRLTWEMASAGNTTDFPANKYLCPIYLGAPEVPVELSSQHIILHLSLPSKMAPELCLQQRVHAVSLLHCEGESSTGQRQHPAPSATAPSPGQPPSPSRA
ncbi:dynein heavy chain domain-containing protein 1 [Lacerta agilis]|uniref:dynein heavy chain domain-containing protein 1 n=1 Tax=Lacerta agilis TaxID=80427 RepID=UPI001419151F|nr:dynein heavy chain domain-containing protein 1 [Lacerta agilis]